MSHPVLHIPMIEINRYNTSSAYKIVNITGAKVEESNVPDLTADIVIVMFRAITETGVRYIEMNFEKQIVYSIHAPALTRLGHVQEMIIISNLIKKGTAKMLSMSNESPVYWSEDWEAYETDEEGYQKHLKEENGHIHINGCWYCGCEHFSDCCPEKP